MDDALKPVALSAVVVDEDWEQALEQALAQIQDISADVVFLFVSTEFADHYDEIVQIVRHETGTPVLLGCGAQSVIGDDQELEDLPALSLLALSLPGAYLQPVHFTQEMLKKIRNGRDWYAQLGVRREDVNAWLLFADPYHLDCEQLIDGLTQAYPQTQIMGGLSSGDRDERSICLFSNDEVLEEGCIGLAIGGGYSVLPLLAQGCEPIGECWTITDVLNNGLIAGISNRPAYQMLLETFQSLSTEVQRRAQRNLMVGLAANEYQDSFTRGSFLIRQLLGMDRKTGALAIGAVPRIGQTIQFQIRDATSADFDLRSLLIQARQDLTGQRPIAALLCTCNGRGMGMFGIPDHDAGMISRELNHPPLAGFFCSGEIGPIGPRSYLHSYAASLGLLIKTM
jgi:small ligand-binding sensory domain FIST